jgi:hypothetical protein
MSSKRSLQLILAIGLFGVAFSGQLSVRELTGATATVCPSPGAPGTVFGYPACIYGLFMYLLIAGLSAWGLLSLRRESMQSSGRRMEQAPSSRPLSRELHS